MKNLVIALVAFLTTVPAMAVDTPTELAGATIVTADKARELMGSGAKIYDVRVATEYVEEHIPGAVSVPYKENSKKEAGFDGAQDKFNLSAVTAGKDAPVIFQCNGADCWKSYKASVLAIKDGFKKVYWFRGGLPEWKQKGYSVEK
ncbi:rhodanese-like domain-containing protein [Bdellovibrio sp. HCB337]|uniref:rhodanese-like domain-containing protein n=1 Tax=Bdellovibrio sp. HCB337 TaxID=3394358 RepID=UPI0039A72E84